MNTGSAPPTSAKSARSVKPAKPAAANSTLAKSGPAKAAKSASAKAATSGVADLQVARASRDLEPPTVPADLRLICAATLAWAWLALTIAWPTTIRAALLGLTVIATLGLALVARHHHRRRRRLRQGRHSRPSRLAGSALLAIAAVTLLQVSALAHDLRQALGPLEELVADSATVTLVGKVVTDPRRMTSRFGTESVRVTLDAREVRGRGSQDAAYGLVAVTGGPELMEIPWWSTVEVTGRIRAPTEARGTVGELRALGAARILSDPNAIARGAEVLRTGLRDSVAGLPADAKGLLPGLVIGDTSGISPDLDAAMRTTGMTHLTAVSGSNVAVVIGLTFAGCALVGVPRRLRPWVAMLMLGGFVVLARPEPSVIRAATMGAIGLIGLSRSHRSAGLPVLGGAVLVVLTVDPWLARSYGFVLSTLAALGLLLFAGPWGEAITARMPWRASRWGPRLSLLGPAVAVPLAAQVVCGPVIVLLQGSVSVVAVLANLLAAPLVPVATVGGVACAGIALISTTLAGWLAWIPAIPTLGIAWIARALAAVPGATIPWPEDAFGAALLTVLTVGLLLIGPSLWRIGVAHPLLVIAAVVILVASLVPTRTVTWPPAGWRVVVCDVGQGDGIVVRSGPTSAVVVDVGPDPAAIDGCLDRLGVQVVEAVILTHFHADHVDGLAGVGRGRDVRALVTTTVLEPEGKVRTVTEWADREGLTPRQVWVGEVLTFDELTATVWAPIRRIEAGSVPNNSSVVLTVETGGVRALLLGDIEREAGAALLGQVRRQPTFAQQSRSFDLVKTPHHGSSNLDAEFMAAIRAPVAVVSVGEDNDYGHPTQAHLDLLRRLGFATYRTDLNGDVALISTADGVAVVAER